MNRNQRIIPSERSESAAKRRHCERSEAIQHIEPGKVNSWIALRLRRSQ